MKSDRLAYALPAMMIALLCVGCNQTDKSSSDTQYTTSITAATSAETQTVYEDPVTMTEYTDYDAFAAAMAEQYPGIPLYTPPQEVATNWTCNHMEIDVNRYAYTYYDSENDRNILLEISTTGQYDTIQERLDELSQYTSDNPSEIVVQEEQYVVEYYPNDNDYVLYGIAAESKTNYTLVIWNGDGNLDTRDDLVSLRKALQI